MQGTFRRNVKKIIFLILLYFSSPVSGNEYQNIRSYKDQEVGPFLFKDLLELRKAFKVDNFHYVDSIFHSKNFIKERSNGFSLFDNSTKIVVNLGTGQEPPSGNKNQIFISLKGVTLKNNLEALVEALKYDDDFFLSEYNTLDGKYVFYYIQEDYTMIIAVSENGSIHME